MLPGRASSAGVGRTRTCPHCKATILESSAICPQCRHHLKFGAAAAPGVQARKGETAFRIEGELRHTAAAGDWEYSVVLTLRNEKGEEIARQVVGVGALRPTEARSFTLAVEVVKPPGGGRP